MKKTISLLLILFSLQASSQIVAGLYSGTLFNDTTKMLQQYQLALSEYKGKITGYSYTTYVVNDTFYYGIRKINAKKENGKLIVEDDKFITNNFPEAPSKGVKRISIFELDPNEDTVRSLKGRWETNKTKVYYSVSGTSETARDSDSSQSALISHLKELKIISTPVYQDEKPIRPNKDIAKKNDVKNTKKETSNTNTVAKNNKVEDKSLTTNSHPQNKKITDKIDSAPATGSDEKKPDDSPVKQDIASVNKNTSTSSIPAQSEQKTVPVKEDDIDPYVVQNIKKTSVNNEPKTQKKDDPKIIATNAVKNQSNEPKIVSPEAAISNVARQDAIVKEKQEVKNTEIKANQTAVNFSAYENRINKEVKSLEVMSDSLVLSFYDNGVVDGDMISVYLNGENIINNTKLTAVAMKKTVYLKDINKETIQLNLVAENLGSLPPNTGLLVVQDGDIRYQVHFSADLQTNATIVFKKKK
ncbi:MAG TPA: hypothetical protein VGD33_07605 [Chitinophagaceae bacterium]